MALLEDRTAVFIVRVWCERGDEDSSVSEWRGSVEHVQSGQRLFFRNLDALCDFMKPHLESIGIDAQQRFWERISSVMEDAAGADRPPAAESIAVPVAVAPSGRSKPSAARKRR